MPDGARRGEQARGRGVALHRCSTSAISAATRSPSVEVRIGAPGFMPDAVRNCGMRPGGF